MKILKPLEVLTYSRPISSYFLSKYLNYMLIRQFFLFNVLKVLSSEMDRAKSGLIG
jgi:hypothetical protein